MVEVDIAEREAGRELDLVAHRQPIGGELGGDRRWSGEDQASAASQPVACSGFSPLDGPAGKQKSQAISLMVGVLKPWPQAPSTEKPAGSFSTAEKWPVAWPW